MSPYPAQYGSGVISGRLRRLRTIAAVLLVAAISMAVFGARVLTPAINHAAGAAVKPGSQVSSTHYAGQRQNVTPLNLTKKEAEALRIDVLFEAAYWVVWIILIVSLLLVAWMDLREVSRTYLNQRRELWAASAKSVTGPSSQALPESEANPDSIRDSNAGPNPPASA